MGVAGGVCTQFVKDNPAGGGRAGPGKTRRATNGGTPTTAAIHCPSGDTRGVLNVRVPDVMNSGDLPGRVRSSRARFELIVLRT